jgi:hypothetical protein
MSATQTTRNFSSYDVVILGAGYAGLMAALRLSQKRRGLRIALVSIRDQFLERVRLQETIVAAVAPRIASISAFVAGTNVEFICGSVASLDADQRRILVQLVKAGGAERPIEVVWGIGVVQWEKDGRVIDRPLLERSVDLELDDAQGGRLCVRPTSAETICDLKPYEEFGCAGLPGLSDLVGREIQRAADIGGISPFIRESFEPILAAAASRLDPEGAYAPDNAASDARDENSSRLVVTDRWVLFARPRSQHAVLPSA